MINGQNLSFIYLEGYRGQQDTPDLEFRASPRLIWIGTAGTLEQEPRQVADALREKLEEGAKASLELVVHEQERTRTVDRLEREILEVVYDEQENAVRVILKGDQEQEA